MKGEKRGCDAEVPFQLVGEINSRKSLNRFLVRGNGERRRQSCWTGVKICGGWTLRVAATSHNKIWRDSIAEGAPAGKSEG